MSSLGHLEKQYFEELFEMEDGYVLDFSNDSFERFFKTTIGDDIYDDKYNEFGNSKAKRLRSYWDNESDEKVGIILSEMLDLWVFGQQKQGNNPEENSIYKKCRSIVNGLVGEKEDKESSKEEFLEKDFEDIPLSEIELDEDLISILSKRFEEAQKALKNDLPLSTIFMCGSILEGLLFGMADKYPKDFNKSELSAKNKEGEVKTFRFWSLSQFIDVAHDIGILELDVKKFSHYMRDFRNYIHPYEQFNSGFNPSIETARICMQVLRAGIISIHNYDNQNGKEPLITEIDND